MTTRCISFAADQRGASSCSSIARRRSRATTGGCMPPRAPPSRRQDRDRRSHRRDKSRLGRGSGALLHCRTMATVPQRELRNDTAGLLRRVEAGETVRITSNGRAVADLVPVERAATFVSLKDAVSGIGGVLRPDDRLDEELRELDVEPADPFG